MTHIHQSIWSLGCLTLNKIEKIEIEGGLKPKFRVHMHYYHKENVGHSNSNCMQPEIQIDKFEYVHKYQSDSAYISDGKKGIHDDISLLFIVDIEGEEDLNLVLKMAIETINRMGNILSHAEFK
jgi:hypothetical protein